MFTQHLHHPHPRHSAFLLGLVFIGLLLLMGCEREGSSGGPGSPLKVRASISPAPIVGQEVTWHIEMASSGPELPNTTLSVTLPAEVELVSGESNWHGDIPAGGTVAVDLVIRVTTPGEWKITARARSVRSATTAYGIEKTLYITSSTTSAEIVEDIYRTGTPIPTLQFLPTFTPESAPTSNPY